MRKLACVLLIGFTALNAGCSPNTDATFAARNAEVEVDLQSLVRTQSNDLLSLTQELATLVGRNSSSSKKLNRELEKTITHMDQLHMNLPELLAAQDVEIAELRQMVSDGAVGKASLRARAQKIQSYRKALIASLDASTSRVTLMAQKLAGQIELRRQAQTAQGLAHDLEAARTMIAMQL